MPRKMTSRGGCATAVGGWGQLAASVSTVTLSTTPHTLGTLSQCCKQLELIQNDCTRLLNLRDYLPHSTYLF